MQPKRQKHSSAEQLQQLPRPVVAWAGHYQAGDKVAAHSHPRAQLLYAVQGVMQVHTPGSVWTIPSHRALWLPPGVEHDLFMMSDVQMRTLYIDAAVAQTLGQECRAVTVSALLKELILALLQEPAEYPQPGRGEHLVALILSEIQGAACQTMHLPWPQDRRLQRVCQWLLDSVGTSHSIDQLAAMSGASSRTLMRLFSKETGLSYRQWLRQLQLAEAVLRLQRGEPVARIAAALGYRSPSAFTAMFKRSFALSPQLYAQRTMLLPTMQSSVAS